MLVLGYLWCFTSAWGFHRRKCCWRFHPKFFSWYWASLVTNNTQILTLSIYLCFSTPCLSHHCSLSPLQPIWYTLVPVNNVRYKIDTTKFSHKLLWIDFKLLLGINMYYHYQHWINPRIGCTALFSEAFFRIWYI